MQPQNQERATQGSGQAAATAIKPNHKNMPSQQLPKSVNVKANESKLSKQRLKPQNLNESVGIQNYSTINHAP